MRDTPESKERIRTGSIVQITPEHHDKALQGALGVVTNKDSWGVSLRMHGGAVISMTWNLIEPTGGMEIFRPDGARWDPDAPSDLPVRHHP